MMFSELALRYPSGDKALFPLQKFCVLLCRLLEVELNLSGITPASLYHVLLRSNSLSVLTA